MSLFEQGDFTLASGQRSLWKIKCDALTSSDWETLALMLAEKLPAFGFVTGVPRGGYKLAKALERYASGTSYPTLVVDDVWTTGGSMLKWMDDRQIRGGRGAVVFARGPVPEWLIPLFQMP